MMENEDVKFAGFWIRVLASLLDFLILILLAFINMYAIFVLKNFPLYLFLSLLLLSYKPFMEFRYGATLGKMALNIKVLTNEFEPIQLKNALLRATPWLISGVYSILLGILTFSHPDFNSTTGFAKLVKLQSENASTPIQIIINIFFFACVIAVAFNERKRGIHDKIGGTLCVIVPEKQI